VLVEKVTGFAEGGVVDLPGPVGRDPERCCDLFSGVGVSAEPHGQDLAFALGEMA
jgi:hypothetical protein